jgi:hypothetical protein
MKNVFPALLALAVGCVLGAGCDDTIPAGLRPTPPGTGPEIVFDLARRPLPEIPAPNDVATFADPTSRTGRRVNVSLLAPSYIEYVAREGFGTMEGWGTFMPITVAFQKGKDARPLDPAIDLERVAARMRRDGHDFVDDPVYVVNLRTGVPVPLDMGDGDFPVSIRDRDLYYPNDPRAQAWNVLFETQEEGAGLSQSAYRPELDSDADGVLDHPNTLGRGQIDGIDNVLTWYERQTDTLILRPLVPLEEKTEYAVVLTDRLVGPGGEPVRSPFSAVHHPAQREATERLRSILADVRRANYYGDIAGTGLAHVAFTWSFTTAPVTEDLRLLRDGLHGKGPFARLATEVPPVATAAQAAGLGATPADNPPGWQNDRKCAEAAKHPYILKLDQAAPQIVDLFAQIGGLSPSEVAALKDSFQYVDYLVVGTYPVSYLMGDPNAERADERFRLDYRTGEGRIGTDVGHFWMAVPKKTATAKQPFPAVIWSHGTGLSGVEVLIRAGWLARHGLATVGYDAPGHGLALEPGQLTLLRGVLFGACAAPWVAAVSPGRARDLDGDGKPDSGGLLWTAYTYHSRDNIRQTVLDAMQLTRVLRGFDGVARSEQDYDGDGTPDLAGDFDSDGVPDVGGTQPMYASGNSFGGIVSAIQGALDPNVSAAAPISGAAGLSDVSARSFGVVDAVMSQVITPLVIAVPASDRPRTSSGPQTNCATGQRSVRLLATDLTNVREIELACLNPDELPEGGATVIVTNLTTGERRCDRVAKEGRFRVPIPASAGDRLDVQVVLRPDAVRSYDGCEVLPNVPYGRTIRTFEQPAPTPRPIADGVAPCPTDACAQFQGRFYPVGAPLEAVQTGLGLRRQSPEIRRLLSLSQATLDAADPINYAPLYALRTPPAPDGKPQAPRGLMVLTTVGDHFVPAATGDAIARAAGALPFLPPQAARRFPDLASYATPAALFEALGQKTPDEVLVDGWVLEGNSMLGRTPAGAACAKNYAPSATCTGSDVADAETCRRTLYDADWYAEGADKYDAQHPPIPLRLARFAGTPVVDGPSLDAAWAPRLLGAPFSGDGNFEPSGPLISLVNAYVNPTGAHVFVTSDTCKAFDDNTYFLHLAGRFLSTGGADAYFLSHPRTHRCLATQTCPIFQ